jgi:hypothetical protein
MPSEPSEAFVAELAHMTKIERAFLWRRQFLNPYAFEGLTAGYAF